VHTIATNPYPNEKVYNPMTWFEVTGIISTSALFLPVITTLALRLAWYKSFPALLAYYILVFGFNFLSLNYFKPDQNFVYYYGVTINFLDAPLMLTFMTYFSKTAAFRKKMKLFIPALLVFEIVVIIINGFNLDSAIIVMGPGLLTVFGFSVVFFFHLAKIAITRQKAVGKTCMVAAMIFAYGGYCFIYMIYYILDLPDKYSTFILYFLVNIVSCLLLTIGIALERRRVRHLIELQTARKELKIVYGREEITTATSKKQPQWKNL